MDKLTIRNLELYGYHGVLPEEARLGQKFRLSMDLYLDVQAAGVTDDLSLTVDYGEVCRVTEKIFLEKRFQLLEACGENLCQSLLTAFPALTGIDLHLEKPWAPIGLPLDAAGVFLSRHWHRAFLGLGSNLGDKKAHLDAAITTLTTPDTRVKRVSSYYLTTPVGYADQDDFLNAVVEVETLRSPRRLLALCQAIETQQKRVRTFRNGPRTIDVDILLYDSLVTEDETLTLPHPRMTDRLFVLVPLAEIAPMALVPLDGRRVFQIKEALANQVNLEEVKKL